MQLPIIDSQGQAVGQLPVSDELFGREFNEPLVHQVVVACKANQRGGTRKQKGRSEIAKSTRKPWKQKGTGNARAGMASSPLWRGGGKIFPNLPDENFHQKINRKMFRGAMASLLSQRAKAGQVSVVEEFKVASHKTKDLLGQLRALSVKGHALLVVENFDAKFMQAGANIPTVTILEPMQLNPLLILAHPRLLVTKAAVGLMEKAWLMKRASS